MATPEVVLFDALGTLVELEPPGPALRAGLAARAGIQVSAQDADAALAAEISFYRSHLHEGCDAASLARLRRSCAEVLGAALPARAGAIGRDLLEAILLDALNFTAFPDTQDALKMVRLLPARAIVVSNWDVSLHDVLARLGLRPLLDGVVTSADAGVRKPAPPIFEQALRLASTDAEHAVHVGDSLSEDVAGARAAGIEPILLRRGGEPGPPDVRTISGLDELAEVLAARR